MNVLVLGGGIFPERAVSLKSSSAVYRAVLRLGISAEYYDWTGDDNWLNGNLKKFDIVLPILHGSGGEDGLIQSILEDHDIDYLGSGVESSKLCFNKSMLKKLLRKNNIATPESSIVDSLSYRQHELFNRPHILKPVNGGSSLDNLIVDKLNTDKTVEYQKLFEIYGQMLLEELIVGTEITVPILSGLELPVVEVIPPKGGAFDYDNKYNGKTKELIPPKNLSAEENTTAISIATKIHSIAGCRHISRTDIIKKDDTFYVLEINTMPGMTDQSIFPKAVAHTGLGFDAFIEYLLKIVKQST